VLPIFDRDNFTSIGTRWWALVSVFDQEGLQYSHLIGIKMVAILFRFPPGWRSIISPQWGQDEEHCFSVWTKMAVKSFTSMKTRRRALLSILKVLSSEMNLAKVVCNLKSKAQSSAEVSKKPTRTPSCKSALKIPRHLVHSGWQL
jgi:hypothetical protein